MNPSSILVLGLLAVTGVLLATERLRADLVAILVLAALMLMRVLEPGEALSGFSNPATVAVAAMFVISAGLQASGVVQFLGDRLLHLGPTSAWKLTLVTAAVILPVSAFINNTAAVAIFLPIVLRACHEGGVSPSRLMMPLSYFAILGGTCTLIGTSTNILVSSIAEDRGLRPFGMFEFAGLGLVLAAICGGYLLVIGLRLIPIRAEAKSLTEGFHLNAYLSEVVVGPGSELIGRSLAEAALGERFDLEVLGHVRDGAMVSAPDTHGRLREGDILLVKAPASTLVNLIGKVGLSVRQGKRPGDADLQSARSVLMEAVITANSDLEGRTMKGVDFRNRFGATALALRRHGEDIREKIGHIRMTVGDELLILVPQGNLERLRGQRSFLLLEEYAVPVIRKTQMLVATAIAAGLVVVATAGWYSIAEAAVAAAVLMVVTGCVPVRRVYEFVEWRVIFLLAGLIPLGRALEVTGAAETSVDALLRLTGDAGPHVVLGLFFLFASALTGVMSNTATAALLAPLAITCAGALGVDPRPFLIAVTLASSAAFYTPIGYQTNLLVYGPGGYRFFDFVRVGGPLNVLYWLGATALIPSFFPF